jgi:hypothetical protein
VDIDRRLGTWRVAFYHAGRGKMQYVVQVENKVVILLIEHHAE